MLKIRFQRVGRRHEPVFRLVLVDSHSSPKTGNVKEILGSYDSRRGEKAEVKADRVKYWIGLGAQTSDTVHNILVSKKIIEGKKINVLPKKQPIIKEKSEEEVKVETSEVKEEEKAKTPEETPESEDASEEVKAEVEDKVEEKAPEENQAPNEEPKEEAQVVEKPDETITPETDQEKDK